MRKSYVVIAALTASLIATSAMAQMGGAAPAAGGGMGAPAAGAAPFFSKEDMAMMIVNREKATKGMTPDQIKAARDAEMASDRAETPAQRLERKHSYEVGWSKLSDAEKSDALAKADAAAKARAAAAANGGAAGGGMGGGMK